MSITVKVAGVDRSTFVSKIAPASWDDTLNGRGTGSITFNVPFGQLATFRPVDGQTVLIEEDLGGGPVARFGGFLVEPEANELPQEKYIIFGCGMQDNNAIADRRTINASYDTIAFEDVVDDIVSNVSGDGLTGESITQTGVATGAAVTIDFPTIYVTEAFNDLAIAAGGWWWNIDHDKDLTFAPRTAVPAPSDLTAANTLQKTVKLRAVKEKYRNVEIVLAGKDDFPIAAMFEDATEITARGTLEGTSGRYEHIEERQDILDGVLAEELAEDLVTRFGVVTLLFECVTRDPGYASGQEVDATFPNLELSATTFLIDSVSASIVYADEDGIEPEIWYSIHAITGDPFGGWMEHFRKRPGTTQTRNIVPAPGVTVECDPGVVVHDPPPGPWNWFQGPASAAIAFTPSAIGITHQEAGTGGHMLTVRRGGAAGTEGCGGGLFPGCGGSPACFATRQNLLEGYAISVVDEDVAVATSLCFSWDEVVEGSFKTDMVIKPDNSAVAVVERGAGGADPVFSYIYLGIGGGLVGSVVATGMTDSNTGFEGAWVGNYIYIPDASTANIFVFDVTDPSFPTLEIKFVTSLTDCNSVVPSTDGSYLFVTGTGNNLIAALDISDPTNITEVDTAVVTGLYESIDLRSDDDLISGFVRADAANLRWLILPVTVGGGASTFGTPLEGTIAQATAIMDGLATVFNGPTAHTFASKPAESPSNSQRSYTFDLNEAETAFTLTEILSYNHGLAGNFGPTRSYIGNRVVQLFGFNTNAQVTYGIATYPLCVELETQWPLEVKFGGTGFKSYFVGDILYADGIESLARRGIGTVGQVLTVVDSVPDWTTLDIPSGQVTASTSLLFVGTDVEIESDTLQNITGLSANVASGETYYFRAELFFDILEGGAHKWAIDGTCAGSIRYQVRALDDETSQYSIVTSGQHAVLGGVAFVSSGHFIGYCEITGSIDVTSDGTLVPQAALI